MKKFKWGKKNARIRHIIFYVLLGIAICAVQIFFPQAIETALTGVQTLSQKINVVAKDVTTALLTVAGLIYAFKALSK